MNNNNTNHIMNEESGANPFLKIAALSRTPPTTPNTPHEVENEVNSRNANVHDTATPLAQSSDASKNVTEANRGAAFNQLGCKIDELIEMLVGRRSIHQPMRDLIVSMSELYKSAKSDKCKRAVNGTAANVATTVSKSTQVSPQRKAANTPKRSRDDEDRPLIQPKRKMNKLTTTNASPRRQLLRNAEQSIVSIGNTVVLDDTPNQWKKVKKKSANGTRKEKKKSLNIGKSNPRRQKTRPDAIIIAKVGDTSYANILKLMKTEPSLKSLGESVNKIRKTAKGELLLELKGNTDVNSSNFKEITEMALQSTAEVRTLCQEVSIQCCDIDEITTAEEICAAIEEQIPAVGAVRRSAVKSLRLMRDGTQTAQISLPAKAAHTLIAAGHIRVGWVRCRIRERISPTQCFRCLEYGHLARSCKNAIDRTNVCRRCSESGHIAKTCTAQPKCAICDTKAGSAHATGSYQCPAYKKAVRDATNRNV